MIIPPYLRAGDTIGITAPAGFASHERIAGAVAVLADWGFKVKVGKTIGARDIYFSGSADERLADLQDMLDDDTVKAVLPGRGGYGMSQIIDRLDFSRFVQAPKWICGFSDITVLHSHILQQFGIATLHSPMCGAFSEETKNTYYIQSVLRALKGEPEKYEFGPHPLQRNGEVTGILTGGNLAILGHLTGSRSQVDAKGKILFIEDIGEHLYHIDRLLLNLKRSGQVDGIAGLVCGSFTEMEDTDRPYGKTLEEIVMDNVKEYDFTVAFGLPCGHATENVTLRLGMEYGLVVGEGGALLEVR